VAARIEEAAGTSWQQIERDSTEAEARRDRALGLRRIWGPKEAMEMLALAVSAAMARDPGLSAGEALAVLADHYVSTWERTRKRRRTPRWREEVLARTGGLCAAPGCTRAAEHVHHVVFRSEGGSDEPSNLVGLCWVHHQRGVHFGVLTVTGRAGERLVWRLPGSEVWITEGNDRVRRLRPDVHRAEHLAVG
jgi:hypothetical protein